MFDAGYLLQIRLERKTDQNLLKTDLNCQLIRQLSISLSSNCCVHNLAATW